MIQVKSKTEISGCNSMNKRDENLIDKRINFNYDEIISEFSINFEEILIPAAQNSISRFGRQYVNKLNLTLCLEKTFSIKSFLSPTTCLFVSLTLLYLLLLAFDLFLKVSGTMDMNSVFGTGRNFPVLCAHVFQLEILHVHVLKITKPFKTNPKIAKLILLKAEGTSSLLFNGPRICHIISPMGNVYQSGFLLGTENCHNGKHNIVRHNDEASTSHSPQLASIQVKSFRVILK